jgi:hypothetical protein
MNAPQDKKLVDIVPDDEPGKEIETEYDESLKGPMSGRMKPQIRYRNTEYGEAEEGD